MSLSVVSGLRSLGSEDWRGAALQASGCHSFRPDVEEEQIADEAVSCYNCRFRRWTQNGMSCLAGTTRNLYG